MSRNSSGNYSLPAGNPVVSGTTISSSTHNSTMTDIGAEITDSLSRSNKGAMLAPLSLVDGTVAAPGLTFGTDPDCGLYRGGANDVRMGVNTTQVQRWDTSGSTIAEPLATAKGLTATQSTSNGSAVTATGNGTGAGVTATGGATGAGVSGTGGATGGPGVTGTGTGGGNGGTFTGQAAGYGVQGTGGGTDAAGVRGVGGATNGPGGSFQGAGAGAGAVFTGGATGNGVTAFGGATSGVGGAFTGVGASAGVTATGGATGGAGVTASGGATNAVGGAFTGTGTNYGVTATGGGSNGAGALLQGGATAGAGAVTVAGSASSAGTRTTALSCNNGDIDFSNVTDPDSTTAHSDRLGPKNIVKAWARISVSGGTATVNDGFNITSAVRSGSTVVVTFASSFANSAYACVVNLDAAAATGDQWGRVQSRTASTVTIAAWDVSAVAVVDLSVATAAFDLICVGAQ